MASWSCQPSSTGFLVQRRVVRCRFGVRPCQPRVARSGRAQQVTPHLLSSCCIPLPGSPAELSPACRHTQGSRASAGNPSSSSSLVPGLAGEPASKQNFQFVSLFSEAAWLQRWLSVALKPAWEWADSRIAPGSTLIRKGVCFGAGELHLSFCFTGLQSQDAELGFLPRACSHRCSPWLSALGGTERW